MVNEIPGWGGLSSAEQAALLAAPSLIIALVGAADGGLNAEEREWGIRFAQAQTYGKRNKLVGGYYEEASDHLYHKVQTALANAPADPRARNAALSQQLAELNPILAKLDPVASGMLYRSFLGLAQETAKSSGGFLRVGAISPEEQAWTKLPMLTPIPMPRGYEEVWEDEEEAPSEAK